MEREAYNLMDNQEASHWWFVARRRIIADLLDRFIPLPPDATILEAGCGTGGNLPLLSSHGKLSAFEYDPEARAIAAQKSGIDVAPGRLPEEVGFDDSSFDLIALLDVLEHLDEDDASLAALKPKLTQGGKVLITVPAAPWLWSEHDVMHHHKRRYTKSQIRKLLGDAGYTDIKAGYFNSLLFPFAVLDRALKNVGLRSSAESENVGPLLNRVFEKVFASEARLMRFISFPLGLSIYAIASRES